MMIHSRKMNINNEYVNFKELSRSTEDFNGAMLKVKNYIDLRQYV